MFKALITEFPLSDVPKERTVTEEKIRKYTYTKEEVDVLISAAVKEAVAEAKRLMKSQWQNIIVMPQWLVWYLDLQH